VVFGDTRKCHLLEKIKLTNVDQTREPIIRKIAEFNPAFVINTGDLVLKGSSQGDWSEFDTLNKVWQEKNIPYYPVLGNHEYKGDRHQALNNYFTRFPHINQQKWYTFTRGNIAFIVLDSNFDELGKSEFNQQRQWLEQSLTKYMADAVISSILVFFHHPPFTNSNQHKPDKQVQTHFIPLFEKSSKVKFVFAGHVHSYERFKIKGINYVVSGGGGAPTTRLREPEKWRYPDEYGIGKPRGTHFCILTVWSDKIQFKTLHINPDKLTWQEGDFAEITH
jgi:3',5'-cyclic AMP phosphodiesterase CpdA